MPLKGDRIAQSEGCVSERRNPPSDNITAEGEGRWRRKLTAGKQGRVGRKSEKADDRREAGSRPRRSNGPRKVEEDPRAEPKAHSSQHRVANASVLAEKNGRAAAGLPWNRLSRMGRKDAGGGS